MRRQIIVAAIAFTIGIALTAAWMQYPQTMQECVLDQMRGQPDSMRAIAIRVCDKRHPGEVL